MTRSSPAQRPITSHVWARTDVSSCARVWKKRGWEGAMAREKKSYLPAGSVLLLNLLNHLQRTKQNRAAWCKAARFLISFLIPPDRIHPGFCSCNPLARYPPCSICKCLPPHGSFVRQAWHMGLQPFQKRQMYQHPFLKPLCAFRQSTINTTINARVCVPAENAA